MTLTGASGQQIGLTAGDPQLSSSSNEVVDQVAGVEAESLASILPARYRNAALHRGGDARHPVEIWRDRE